MSLVHASKGTLAPASEHLRSEVAILTGIARATLDGRSPQIDWGAMADDYDVIRDHIANVVPGFEDFNRRLRTLENSLKNSVMAHRADTSAGPVTPPLADSPVDKPGKSGGEEGDAFDISDSGSDSGATGSDGGSAGE